MVSLESKWVQLVRKRYEPPKTIKMSYTDENNLVWLLNAPEQYEVEEKMLEFAESHPNASMEDLLRHFDSIVPDGLAPGDSGADLLEDD